jgi:hypothetical protein
MLLGSEENLGTLMDVGMNVARFNFSHGDHESHGAVLERLRKMAKVKSRNIGEYSDGVELELLEYCRRLSLASLTQAILS